MKNKRHYFSLSISIANLTFSVILLSFFLWALIGIILFNKEPILIVLFSIFTLISVVFLSLTLFVDGFANWRVVDDSIVFSKLFRKKKVIEIGKILKIKKTKGYHFLILDEGSFELQDFFMISSVTTSIKIVCNKDSELLIDEICKRLNIVICND